MSERLFGTDGVRGVANQVLGPELALRLGLAYGHILRRSAKPRPRVVVGMDSRISSPMLEQAICSGLCAMGVDVIAPGLMPTPAVARVTKETGASGGVVISASHNPFYDNGIKFFDSTGYKLDDSLELEIEELLPHAFTLPRAIHADIGRIHRETHVLSVYRDHVENTMEGCRFDGLKIVVDAGNGAASELAPAILRDLGAEVVQIACQPNGININDNCGATAPKIMAEAVLASKADFGVSFDGDADRAIFADATGKVIDGDHVMAICGIALAQTGRLPGKTVVGTIMSNMGLEIALREHGITLLRTNVGDRHVSERMRSGGYTIGGEKSGHVIFGALTTTGDGILTALQLFRVVKESGRTLCDLAGVLTELPQTIINIPVKDRVAWETDPAIHAAIRLAESSLNGDGRINVRASGTEPLIRVMVEAPDHQTLALVAEPVAAQIRQRWGK